MKSPEQGTLKVCLTYPFYAFLGQIPIIVKNWKKAIKEQKISIFAL